MYVVCTDVSLISMLKIYFDLSLRWSILMLLNNIIHKKAFQVFDIGISLML